MAKKIVRGITDVKTINNQDFDTNNVNDLLSDGQYNYIHRKKGKNEEYHNLTDNIKTISSDNTDLLTVTNNNKTTNTATLHPKHDAQKEQVLESTRNTISIHHGENGTAEKTTVDTNPQKVLEHENLLTGYGLRKDTSNNQTTITMDTGSVTDGFDLNNFNSGLARASYFTNAPYDNVPFYVVALGSVTGSVYQIAFKRLNSNDEINQMFIRTKMVGTNNWSDWKQYGMDSDTLNTILAGKQNKLTAGDGITIQGNTISATGGAHDSQKEQVIESTRNTVTINHGTNGTDEKTTVDTNPQKVLEHEKLKTGDGLTTSFNTDETTIMFKATKKPPETNLNTLGEGVIRGNGFSIDQVPSGNQGHSAAYVTINTSDSRKVQFYIRESGSEHGKIKLYYRFIINGEVTEWKEMVGDSDELNNQLAQKQNKLTAMDGISITGDSIYLTSLDDYSEDLNNLTYTCTAKPIDNAPNLPTGVAGNGVLSVIRVGNVVSQTYHALDNNVYYRITNISSSAFVWTPWVKVNTTAV